MKNKLHFLLLFIITISYGVCTAAETFSDINGHWAQKYISILAENSTVNGYEDGTFRPENTVSKAELVKIAGFTDETATNVYTDVNQQHWAYDYIVSSGFETTPDGAFLPDAPASRMMAARILYKKYGGKKIFHVPDIITDQAGEHKNAVAFLYANGILIGDDGVNLRLNDTLTRAEMAALAVRCGSIDTSSNSLKFSNYINDSILKEVFEGSTLFDGKYDKTRVITNGEVARAAVRLMTGESIIDFTVFPNYAEIFGMKGEYAKETALMCGLCLGKSKATEKFASSPANGGDVILMLTYAILNRGVDSVVFSDAKGTYSDAALDGVEGRYTAAAFENNFAFYTDGALRPNETVSAADIAALIMQIDYKFSLLSICGVTAEKYETLYRKIDFYMPGKVTENSVFTTFVGGVPDFVYNAPFMAYNDNWSVPAVNYPIASEFKTVFAKELQNFLKIMKEKHNIELKCTYYPSLVYSSGNGFVLRVEFEVLNVNPGAEYVKVFGTNTLQKTETYLYNGEKFFAEITCSYENIQANLTK